MSSTQIVSVMNAQLTSFGEPLLMLVRANETVEATKERVRAKLGVPAEDFAKVSAVYCSLYCSCRF